MLLPATMATEATGSALVTSHAVSRLWGNVRSHRTPGGLVLGEVGSV